MKRKQSKSGQSEVKHAIWLKIFGIATVALVGVVSAMVFEFDPLSEPQVNTKTAPAQVASNSSPKAGNSLTGMQFAAVMNQTDNSKFAQQISMDESVSHKIPQCLALQASPRQQRRQPPILCLRTLYPIVLKVPMKTIRFPGFI